MAGYCGFGRGRWRSWRRLTDGGHRCCRRGRKRFGGSFRRGDLENECLEALEEALHRAAKAELACCDEAAAIAEHAGRARW